MSGVRNSLSLEDGMNGVGMMFPVVRRVAILIAVLLLGGMAAATLLGPADAKKVVNPDCDWFGTPHLCDG